ncbi:hypothetical protein OOU_Y34scaffold00766g10 [Pyricularia oryzae Y34]|uniref:Uncharacterized protein n=1 Tax=Pyricularia oryzae (strain Y34) TaxID=1143189 RepID=A0AA97NQH5_PYRO3|nr:hypothetical protein OOU_Y34scaffold00766g10 [Pyricularia oryzae Y34]
MHGCYCRDEAKPGSHERTRTTTVSGGKKEPMSPTTYNVSEWESRWDSMQPRKVRRCKPQEK